MKQALHYNVIDSLKYKTIEAIPAFDTSGYNIVINGVVSYAEIVFTKHEINEKLEYFKKHMVMEQFYDDVEVVKKAKKIKIKKKDKKMSESTSVKQVQVVDETFEVKNDAEVLPLIKRGRGRPKKLVSVVASYGVLESEKKRGRGRPKGSKNKYTGDNLR